MDDKKIEDIISRIKKEQLNFKLCSKADPEVIINFEAAFGVTLPNDFKTFLKHSNGADRIFFAEDAKKLWRKGEYEEASIIGEGNRILSIEEIIEVYEDLEFKKWKLNEDFKGFYPYIPFFITEDNEKIVFVDQTQSKETPIYFAYHDEPASAWFCVANSFTEFLNHFINSKGQPPSNYIDGAPSAEDYLVALNSEQKRAEMDTPQAIIKRMTAYLKLFPSNSLSFVLRGNAYVKSKQFEKALLDFNKAIDLDSKSAFAYHSRGDMLLNIEKPRMALTDMDSACQLKPNDPYYLVGRADAFYALNRMDEALADCNRAIELDEYEVLAYMTRYKIYLYLGEGYKAEADNDKIDELLANE